MPLASTITDDFSAGIYRGRKAPATASFDLVNFLINDEGFPFRRGGSAYYATNDAPGIARWLNAAYFPGPATPRVIVAGKDDVSAIDTGFATHTIADAFTLATDITQWGRGAMLGGVWLVSSGPTRLFFYGGSLKSAHYGTGTVDATTGSATLTGTGTSWTANVDAGMVVTVNGINQYFVVRSVESDTSLTMTTPAAATVAGATYQLTFGGSVDYAIQLGAFTQRSYLTVAGQRVLFCMGNRVYFTARGEQAIFSATDYHDPTDQGVITGAYGQGDGALIFSTAGVWRIDNLSLDAIDDYGNVQHTIQRASKDFNLWDDYGIAGWAGGIIVPGVDDAYLTGFDFQPTSISQAIRPLWREYVDEGFQPGLASVHRNHYMLPILDDGELVDVLVCRLDRDFAWTRWSGVAAGISFATLTADVAREPKLLGLTDQRVYNLTDCFDPSSANPTDADATSADLEIVTRDYPTGRNQPGFAQRVRLRYELEQGQQTDMFDGAGPLTSPWTAYQAAVPDQADGTVQPDSYSDALRDTVMQDDGTVTLILDPPLAPGGGIYALGVLIRVDGIMSASDGYAFEANDLAGATWAFKLYKDSSFTVLSTSATTTTAAIDGIRITVEGTEIKCYVRAAGLDWAEVISVIDGSHTVGGRPGFYLQDFGAAHALQATSISWGPLPATTSIEFSSDADGGEWTELTERGEQGGGDGWAESDGSLYQWALVARRRERVRFRFRVIGATASFVLRSIELLTRPSGKQ